MIPTNQSTNPPVCPYCGEAFTPRQRGQVFCCRPHRIRYHNAERKRLADLGAALAPRTVDLAPGESVLIRAKETP